MAPSLSPWCQGQLHKVLCGGGGGSSSGGSSQSNSSITSQVHNTRVIIHNLSVSSSSRSGGGGGVLAIHDGVGDGSHHLLQPFHLRLDTPATNHGQYGFNSATVSVPREEMHRVRVSVYTSPVVSV